MERIPTRRPLGRAFWALCGAGLASNIGDGAVLVGFPVLAATLTSDPRLIAGVAVAQRLPWLFLSLLTGALADRYDRRRLIGCVEILRTGVVGALGFAVFARFHPLVAIYLAAFGLGSLDTAFTGASGALLPGIVERSSLGRANGYLYAAQTSGEGVIGPAVGGLLAAAALSLPFLFDSATFVVSGAVLLLMLPRKARPVAAAEEASGRPGVLETVVADVKEGLSWFRTDPAIKLVAGFIAGLAFCQAAVMAVLVLWAERYLHLSRSGYGFLLAVAAVGWVGGAIVTGRTMGRFPPARMLLLAGLVAGGSYAALAAAGSAPMAAGILILEGAAVSTGNVVSQTVRQSLIPPELLGRVGNAMRTCIFGAMPAGALTGGLLAHSFGLRSTFVLAGAAQAVGVGLAWQPLRRALGASRERVAEPVPTDPSVALDDILDISDPVCPVSLDEGLQPTDLDADTVGHGKAVLAL